MNLFVRIRVGGVSLLGIRLTKEGTVAPLFLCKDMSNKHNTGLSGNTRLALKVALYKKKSAKRLNRNVAEVSGDIYIHQASSHTAGRMAMDFQVRLGPEFIPKWTRGGPAV